MKRYLPVMLALAFSALAVAVALFVFRPGLGFARGAAEELRHKVDEVIEEVTEREEADR